MSLTFQNSFQLSNLSSSIIIWIRRISQLFVCLSCDTKIAKIRLGISEREKISDNLAVSSCKLYSSSRLDKRDLLFALSHGFVSELFHNLCQRHYQITERELSIVFEISNSDENKTSIFTLHEDTNGCLQIVEVTKNKLRGDGVNALMQITGILETNHAKNVCLKLHDFLYRLRAFNVINNAKFSASVDELNYSTEFCSDATDSNDVSIFPEKSHYFESSDNELLHFASSGKLTISLPEESKFGPLSFELLAASFDRCKGDHVSTTTRINVYFSGQCDVYDDNVGNSEPSAFLGSIFPFMRLGVIVNDIEIHPSSTGLVSPDMVLIASRPNNFPSSCMVVLKIYCDESAAPEDRMRMIIDRTPTMESVLTYNASVIQAAFLRTMRSSLDKYIQDKSLKKLSYDLETGISLTVSSVRDIIAASPNTHFREACFSILGVDNEHSLGVAMVEKLMLIANFMPQSSSKKRKLSHDEGGTSQQL